MSTACTQAPWPSPCPTGAQAVILPLDLAGADSTRELMACAHGLGLDVMVRVTDDAGLKAARQVRAQRTSRLVVGGRLAHESEASTRASSTRTPFDLPSGAYSF